MRGRKEIKQRGERDLVGEERGGSEIRYGESGEVRVQAGRVGRAKMEERDLGGEST